MGLTDKQKVAFMSRLKKAGIGPHFTSFSREGIGLSWQEVLLQAQPVHVGRLTAIRGIYDKVPANHIVLGVQFDWSLFEQLHLTQLGLSGGFANPLMRADIITLGSLLELSTRELYKLNQVSHTIIAELRHSLDLLRTKLSTHTPGQRVLFCFDRSAIRKVAGLPQSV